MLNTVHGYEDDAGHIVGVAGGSYVLVVEFGDDGPRSWAAQPPSMARGIWLEGSRKWQARKVRIAKNRTVRRAKKRQATKGRH